MSHTYHASAISSAEEREEFARLQRALNDAQPEFTLAVLHAAPKKTWAGMLVLADGTDWNPGSGAGLYLRNEDNTAWARVHSSNVDAFGAVGDGSHDDTTAIQRAINSGAKRVTATAGKNYRITSPLTVTTDTVEIDFEHAELLLDDATGLLTHLKLGDGVTKRNNIKVRNVTFTRQQAATAGYAIDANYVGVVDISGCRIYGNSEIYNGIRVYRGMIVNIYENYVDNIKNYSVHLEGSGTGNDRTVDVTVRNNRFEGGVTGLDAWDFVEGVFCRDNIFYNFSSVCVAVNASSNANGLFSFKFQHNDFDSSGGGLYLDQINNIQITGNWFSNNSATDVQIKQGVTAYVVTGNQFYPLVNGIDAYGADGRINGNLFSGGLTNISINSVALRTSISGNTFSNAQYGVNLGSANNTHVGVNTFSNMSLGQITGSAGTGCTIDANNGDGSRGAVAFVVVGASPYTYTAGSRPEVIYVTGGTVTQIAYGGSAFAFNNDWTAVLSPNQSVTVTYTVAPTILRNTL